jgi:hypothetical protein
MTAAPLNDQDWAIRSFVYTFFVENERPPSVSETANDFKLGKEEARLAYRRLHNAHTLFLQPGTVAIRMANPLSAIATDYVVHVSGKRLWANCAWDSLGIPAMLDADATIEATLRQSGERVTYSIEGGSLKAEQFVVHFPLPFAQWYDDLVYT